MATAARRWRWLPLAGAVLCWGCAPGLPLPFGVSPAPPVTILVQTEVGLHGPDYRLVRTGVEGESRGLTLLLFFKVAPASYLQAFQQLQRHAGLEPGRSQALANVVYERTERNFLLFALPRARVRADVVEFVEPGSPCPADDEGTSGAVDP